MVAADRELGGYWEQQFLAMMRNEGYGVHRFAKAPSPVVDTPDGTTILADGWVLQRKGDNYLCEIKHKNPYKRIKQSGEYGLEQYRLNHLQRLQRWVGDPAMYVIHNHDLSGGRDNRINNVAHWFIAPIADLAVSPFMRKAQGPSYVDGRREMVLICYWPISEWLPLSDWLQQ